MYIKSLYNTHILVNIKYINSTEMLKQKLIKTLIQNVGDRCNMHGYISNNNISIIEYTIGEIINSNIVFNVLYEAIVILPIIGTILSSKVISNEGFFYIADFENYGKIFIITNNVLEVNTVVNIIIIHYYFNNGDKNIYLFGKYIDNMNYLIPEIPTKEECDKYLNIYLRNNINYNKITTINSELETTDINESDINHDYLENQVIENNLNIELIGDKDINSDIENNNSKDIEEIDDIEDDDIEEEIEEDDIEDNKNNIIYGGIDINGEYIINISNIEKYSKENYRYKGNRGGLVNIGTTCYINSILFMLKYNDTFKRYIKDNNNEYLIKMKEYFNDDKEIAFDTPLLIHNLNESIDINLYDIQMPDIFYNKLCNLINGNTNIGKLFYNFERINEEILKLDENYKINKINQEEYNSEYKTINKYIEEIQNRDDKFNQINRITRYCEECNYEMTEIKLINIIELNYNNEDTLQEIINNNNKVKILDIKCDICNKEYYREINKSIILNKDIILLIKDKIDNKLKINRTINVNKVRGKVISYILKSPYNSLYPHYRTLIKDNNILYDDSKIYNINKIGNLIEDIYMIHILLEKQN